MKKSIVSILLALVIILTVSTATFAAVVDDNIAVPYYVYILNTGASFEVNTFSCTCSGSMTARSSATKVKIKMQLQKENDGVWSTVETWEETFTGTSGAMEESATISPFSNYRLKATFTAYSGSDSESATRYAYE